MDNNEFGEQRGELVQSIHRDEEELREAVNELTTAARSTFTVSEQIKANPLAWLIGGFLFGMWLGTLRRPLAVSQRADNY